MLSPNLQFGETNPTPSTLQYKASRLAGLTLVVPAAAAALLTDGEVPIGSLVSLQQYPSGGIKAVLGPVADADSEYNVGVIIGYGHIEQGLQSGNRGSIAPKDGVFKAGDRVVVLTTPNEVFAVPYDTDETAPTPGISTAYFTKAGLLTSVSGGGNVAAEGAVFSSVAGLQLSNQLKTGYLFYRKKTALEP